MLFYSGDRAAGSSHSASSGGRAATPPSWVVRCALAPALVLGASAGPRVGIDQVDLSIVTPVVAAHANSAAGAVIGPADSAIVAGDPATTAAHSANAVGERCVSALEPVLPATGTDIEAAVARLEADRDLPPTQTGAGDSLHLLERDRNLARARNAGSILDAVERTRPSRDGPPTRDPLSARLVALMIDGYERALQGEAALLSARQRRGAPGVDGTAFAGIWSETTRRLITVLDRWPSLWSVNLSVEGGEIDVPLMLLSLCRHDAYKGDAFELPRECLAARMATLPESLAICCLDTGRCVSASSTDCMGLVVGFMAESIDQDAMTAFRYGAAYWAMPAGQRVRSSGKDNRVAVATPRFAVEMLQAAEAGRPSLGPTARCREGEGVPADGGGATGAAIPDSEALERIRASGRLWPSSIDPFRTVPGLRNPRCGEGGGLVCDVALYRACLKSMNPGTRGWLEGRLGPEAKLVLVDPR